MIFYKIFKFQVLILLCQGSDVSNIVTTKLKRIFKIQYLIDLLMEPDLYGKFNDEILEKNVSFHLTLDKSHEKLPKIDKYEAINLEGMTFLKPSLIELIIEIFFKNPIKMSAYDANSKKIENYIEKEINRLELSIINSQYGDPNEIKQYLNYFFQYFLKFVICYYEILENKDFFENEENEENIFKNLAYAVKRQKISFKNKLTYFQTENIMKIYQIAKMTENEDEKYYQNHLFHLRSESEFGEIPKITEEYDDVVKEIEVEKDDVIQELIPESKIRMLGTIKRKRVISNFSKNNSYELWKIFQNEIIGNQILAKVFIFLLDIFFFC